MTDTNITRAEAKQRSTLLTAARYEVHVDLTDVRTRTPRPSRAPPLRASPPSPARARGIDLVAPSLRRAVLNGVELDPAAASPGSGSPLPDLAADNELRRRRRLRLHATPARACTASSTRSTSEVYLYTQFETADAKRMYACFDQPDLKATFALTVTAPATGRSSPTRRRREPERRRRRAAGRFDADAAASRRTSPRWSPGRTTR